MTATILLTLPAVLLIAIGTPRQASLMLGDRVALAGRVALRWSGYALLALSLVIALDGDDRGRQLIAWIGGTGLEAIVIALGFTGLVRFRSL